MAALYAFDLPGGDDAGQGADVPDWIMLLPAGPQIKGRDGRAFRLSDPQAVIDRFHAGEKDLPLDWEHQTAMSSGRVPVAGWINTLELRGGAVFGHVQWTAQGRADVAGRIYRYISPVILFNARTEIFAIVSAALVHLPNLRMPALNRREDAATSDPAERIQMMSTAPQEGAPDETHAPQAGHAPPLEAPPPEEKSAPGAALARETQAAPAAGDPEALAAMNRAHAALQSENAALKSGLAELTAKFDALQAQTHAEKVEAALNTAIAGGRITPSARDYFAQNCATPEGLAAFEAWVKGQPALLSTEMARHAQGAPGAGDPRDLARRAAALQAERRAQGLQATLTECVAELNAANTGAASTMNDKEAVQ